MVMIIHTTLSSTGSLAFGDGGVDDAEDLGVVIT